MSLVLQNCRLALATIQDLRTDSNLKARARGGSVLAWPVQKGKVNEKVLRSNIDLFEYFAEIVSRYKDQMLTVPVLKRVLGDCAHYWKNLPEESGPVVYDGIVADAKAIKSACLCLRRLRGRADRQRDADVSRIAEACLRHEICT